jgi:hypothetical protein
LTGDEKEMKETEAISEAGKKAEKGMKFAKSVEKILRDDEKGKRWAKKMAWITNISLTEQNPKVIIGLLGGEFSKEEMAMALAILIPKHADMEHKRFLKRTNDVAFM